MPQKESMNERRLDSRAFWRPMIESFARKTELFQILQGAVMREEFVQTQNYIKLVEAFSNLDELPVSAPRIGLGYGNFGLGKTFALERIALKENAILFRASETWTKSSLLSKLCGELGLDTKGHSPQLYERVLESFLVNPRTLIIDEVDALTRGDKVTVLEMLRGLHDESSIVLFLVGMEQADAKLKRHRHFYSRIVEFVKFEGIGPADIEKFCTLCDVAIEPDLIGFFAKRYPNLRQIKVILLRLENFCKINGIKSVDLKTFKASGVEHGVDKA